MSSFLFLNNIHLAVEIFGSIIFFIVAWLFFESYLIKKDKFSFSRSLGFLFLSIWQIFHVLGDESNNFLLIFSLSIYGAGLFLVFFSYLSEKLPPKPVYGVFVIIPPLFFGLIDRFPVVASVSLIAITFVLMRRYFKDIDIIIKWLAIGFALLAASSIVSIYVKTESLNLIWLSAHVIKILAFSAIVIWIWKFLSLRIKEEALLVFITTSLFIALLVTTTFSNFYFQRIERETMNNLAANAKMLNFYIDGLKNKALAGSQIIANNEDFISAIKSNDLGGAKKISNHLLNLTGQNFLTVASEYGTVLFKTNFPVIKDETIFQEIIGAEALESRPAVTVEQSDTDGLTIRAAAPILYRGKIIGAVLTGFLLDERFVDNFKKISGLETTILADEKVIASTILTVGKAISFPKEEFLGTTKLLNQEVIGAFTPLKNFDAQTVGILSLTTTPGELLRDANATNRLTMLIVFAIAISLIIPLYRFTVFLTS